MNFPLTYEQRGTSLYNAGFDAAWELDVFGGFRRSVEAGRADVAASVENVRGVLISIQAEVAGRGCG